MIDGSNVKRHQVNKHATAKQQQHPSSIQSSVLSFVWGQYSSVREFWQDGCCCTRGVGALAATPTAQAQISWGNSWRKV